MASVFAGLMAFPALAQAAQDTSCADFMAMDSAAQMKALGGMSDGGMMADDMAAGDKMAAGDNMSGDAMAKDDMAAGDKMAGDDMSKDNMGSGDMKSDAMAPTVEAVAAACKGHPDMMLHDAMMAAESH